MQKTLSREISFLRQKGFANKARGITGLGSILLTSALMGYLSMTIKDLIKGKSPRDPTKIKTFNSAIMQGGGLGIYGDVLFQETRQGSEIGGSLLGPVPLTAFDILQSFKYLKDGKGDLAARSAHKAVTQNIPFLNLFYIKTAFDYIIGYQMMETLSPGVLERIENRMERDYGQEFLFTKPSTKFKGF